MLYKKFNTSLTCIFVHSDTLHKCNRRNTIFRYTFKQYKTLIGMKKKKNISDNFFKTWILHRDNYPTS